MKKIVVTFVTGLFLAAGSLLAQPTLTEVINEFNAGVESLNGQSYETALAQFNNCLALCETVGDEAADMKSQAQEQVVGTHYRQAMTLMKRKQYDKALPYLENTVNFSKEYEVGEDLAAKANKYLPPLYLREGNVLLKQENFDEAMSTFDKVLEMIPDNYKAHQGKGLVYKELGEVENMLSEFNTAKEKAEQKGDQEVIDDINAAINDHYSELIREELMMIDPDDPDYTYLLEICDEAIAANEYNGYAYLQAAIALNDNVEYDAAIEYAEKAIEFESDPLLSGLYYQLGIAYQNTVRYAEACAAFKKVVDENFLSLAEKKLSSLPECE